MTRLRTLLAVLAAAVAATLVVAGPAAANSRQRTMMQDDQLLLREGPAVRAATLNRMRSLGVDVVKIGVYWNEVAPNPRRKPAGFDGTLPGSYDWSALSAAVQGALSRGMTPFLSLGQRAPQWAVKKRTRRNNGTYRPSAREFGRFAVAAGRQFPQVHIWSMWNEPNLASWLQPARSRRGTPISPSLYRNLYLAGYRGLNATAGHAHDTVLLGELMPAGSGSSKKISPLAFLREMACLDRHYHRYRGRAARARGCKRVRRIPTSGIAIHPYAPRGGPRARPRSRDDASIGTLSRYTRTVVRIARRGKLPRRLPLWITEFGFQTNPPDPFQYSIRRVPGFMDESEWMAFRNHRVRSYSQYLLVDDKLSGRGLRRYAGFQQGLLFRSGRAKPGVYGAFRMPAFVRVRGGRVEVFGGLRSAGAGTPVTILSRVRHGHYKRLGATTLNASGYFRKIFRVRGASRRVYRITIAGVSRTKRPARR